MAIEQMEDCVLLLLTRLVHALVVLLYAVGIVGCNVLSLIFFFILCMEVYCRFSGEQDSGTGR